MSDRAHLPECSIPGVLYSHRSPVLHAWAACAADALASGAAETLLAA